MVWYSIVMSGDYLAHAGVWPLFCCRGSVAADWVARVFRPQAFSGCLRLPHLRCPMKRAPRRGRRRGLPGPCGMPYAPAPLENTDCPRRVIEDNTGVPGDSGCVGQNPTCGWGGGNVNHGFDIFKQAFELIGTAVTKVLRMRLSLQGKSTSIKILGQTFHYLILRRLSTTSTD
jgi:hypothetical protein